MPHFKSADLPNTVLKFEKAVNLICSREEKDKIAQAECCKGKKQKTLMGKEQKTCNACRAGTKRAVKVMTEKVK